MRTILLVCGVVSSLLYIAMNVFVATQWEDYSSASQTVSELSAIGAPTRRVCVGVGIGYSVLVVAFGCYAAGWIGGGDAKLAAAIALWFGFDHAAVYLLYASLLGGLLTLLVLRFRSETLPAVLVRQDWVMRLHDQKAGVPYGIALAVAALVVYPDTIMMRLLAM